MFDNSTISPKASERIVLRVNKSLSGRRWLWRDNLAAITASPLPLETIERYAQAIAQRSSLFDMVGRMIAIRGITPEQADNFLLPTLRALMPNPSCMKDMDKAAERIAQAIINHEKIAIFGDYDVDGACSTALLMQVFQHLGNTAIPYIPDRFKEGYGPNLPALQQLVDQGCTLILCTDCGTASHAIFDQLPNTDIIVFDHHKSDTVPNILATVNPNRLDCTSGLGNLCAGGVVFLASVAIVRALRKLGYFSQRPEPDLMQLLDLVALSTVCDVMPLTGLNRALVTQGLKILAKRQRIGLAALLNVAGVHSAPDAFSCGFALGPRINAGGRISESDLGLRLLLCQDSQEARIMAERLDAINRQRQTIEGDMLQQALDAAAIQRQNGHAVIMLQDKNWHAGVVGIVAGRIKEQINRPVLVGSESSDGIIKGSGRSIPGLDLGAAIIAARQAGLLLSGGGHAMAAGYSLHRDQIGALHAFLDKYLAQALHQPSVVDLEIEGVISIDGASIALAKQIGQLTPFGNGNDEPLIALSHVRVVRADRIGREGNTLRLILQGEDGKLSLKALLFRADQNPLTHLLEERNRTLMHMVGWLRADSWNGQENVGFFIKDASFI